jgi:predicted transcriptional regulator
MYRHDIIITGGNMARSDDTYTASVNLPKDLEPRLRALAEHRSESLSATCAAAIRDAIVHYEDGDTTRTRIAKIEQKINLLLLLTWRGMACDGKMEITAEDVRKLRDLVAEIQI